MRKTQKYIGVEKTVDPKYIILPYINNEQNKTINCLQNEAVISRALVCFLKSYHFCTI